jgi:hypothetical protein
MRLESHVTRETTFEHQPMAWLSAEQNGAARPGRWIHGSGMTCQTTVCWNQTQWQLDHKNSRTQSESFDLNGSILEKVAQEWDSKHFWGIARSKKVTVWSRNLLSVFCAKVFLLACRHWPDWQLNLTYSFAFTTLMQMYGFLVSEACPKRDVSW